MISRALLFPAILIASAHCFLSPQLSQERQLVFGSSSTPQESESDGACPANPPTSCHLSSGDEKPNSCCTNTPGGQILLTQFWDSHPATGPADSWTIHGLWPDNCDGTYEASCDPARQYHNITQILERGGGQEALSVMKKYWKDQHGSDETFWQHEWAKHGTCISTLEPRCMGSSYEPREPRLFGSTRVPILRPTFNREKLRPNPPSGTPQSRTLPIESEVVAFFNRTVDLFKSLPTYEWLKAANIVPSASTTYGLDQLQEVAKQYTGQEAVWNCRGHVLNEVWWHFNTVGTVAGGKFVHASPVGPRSTCPYNGIQYLPKGDSGGGGGGGEHRPKHPGHHPDNPPSSRKHFIYVVDSEGQRNGCLISNGNWLYRATCASFSISAGHDDKSLREVRTRRGACAFEDSVLKCAKGLKSEGFEKNGDRLVHDGQDVFYSAKLPEGSTQVPIIKSKTKNALRLEIAAAY